MSNKVSSKDVAKLAGVSQSTVSRAFSSTYNLAPELKERVLKAAKELDYRPNAIARTLFSKRSNIIAVVTSNLDNPFYSTALQFFVKKLQAHSLQSLIFVAEHSEDIDTVINRVLSYQVDLVLIFGAKSSTKLAGVCNENGVPAVLFNRYIPRGQTSAVCCNDYQSGRMVAQELYERGCRNFAYIAGEENVTTNIDRRNGFVVGLQDLGINNCRIIQGGYSYSAGLRAARRMLEEYPKVDACFCANDITAIGVLDYLRNVAHKSVPEEISVIGFDDIPISRQMSYRLSTVRQPVEQMVDVTISTILEILKDPDTKPILKIVDGIIIKRKTTK